MTKRDEKGPGPKPEAPSTKEDETSPLILISEGLNALGLPAPGAVVELRILKDRGPLAGYYDDAEALARDAVKWGADATGAYVTVNPVNPDLLARAGNRLKSLKNTTTDADVSRRARLPIDVDATRAAGISATDDEKAEARRVADAIRDYLVDELGWPESTIIDSGNGAHVYAQIDLPNDDESTTLIRRVLAALAARFDTDRAHVDLQTFNAARIMRLPGTTARKGDSTADRPHRVAGVLAPGERGVVSREALEKLAADAPEMDEPEPAKATRGGAFDARAFLKKHNVEVNREAPHAGGGSKLIIDCPFDQAHAGDGAVFIAADGKLGFKCFHNSCSGRGWKEFRAHFEPAKAKRERAGARTPAAKNDDDLKLTRRQLVENVADAVYDGQLLHPEADAWLQEEFLIDDHKAIPKLDYDDAKKATQKVLVLRGPAPYDAVLHVTAQAWVIPYLNSVAYGGFSGGTGTGKGTGVESLVFLTPDGVVLSRGTDSYLASVLDAGRTIGISEAQFLMKNETVQALLRNGYRRGAMDGFRIEGENGWENAERSIFGPKFYDYNGSMDAHTLGRTYLWDMVKSSDEDLALDGEYKHRHLLPILLFLAHEARTATDSWDRRRALKEWESEGFRKIIKSWRTGGGRDAVFAANFLLTTRIMGWNKDEKIKEMVLGRRRLDEMSWEAQVRDAILQLANVRGLVRDDHELPTSDLLESINAEREANKEHLFTPQKLGVLLKDLQFVRTDPREPDDTYYKATDGDHRNKAVIRPAWFVRYWSTDPPTPGPREPEHPEQPERPPKERAPDAPVVPVIDEGGKADRLDFVEGGGMDHAAAVLEAASRRVAEALGRLTNGTGDAAEGDLLAALRREGWRTQDAERTISAMMEAGQVYRPRTGRIAFRDGSGVAEGEPEAAQADAIEAILELVRKHRNGTKGAPRERVLAELAAGGIPEDRAGPLIAGLKQRGKLYEPVLDHLGVLD